MADTTFANNRAGVYGGGVRLYYDASYANGLYSRKASPMLIKGKMVMMAMCGDVCDDCNISNGGDL